MKILCLTLLFHATLQLQCDKGQITAHVGGEFMLVCKYDTNTFRYNKKYWCQGDAKSSCAIVADSEGVTKTKNTHRSHVIDARRRGLFVKVTHLQFEDAGVYWVGIDKVYADIMTSVNVVITEVPVSKPALWPLSSLVDGPTCWGQPVTVRCGCTKGTAVRYSWYQNTHQKDVLLHHSSDLYLHCGRVDKDSNYYCLASNGISSQGSDILSVQVPVPADSSCIYVISMQGQPMYDCAHRMSTTTAKTPPPTTCQATRKTHPDAGNQSLQINQTDPDLFFSRAWTGVPFWYMLLRWGSFASLLIFLCIVIKCTKARHRPVKRKRRVRFKQRPHAAQ
ncbi:polymeric immunoglobulin receptor-like isoform X2 [Chelmon rostratus]|uniref:polymeric immunoglobulin receptor-like isoform X2 n=1 Tax=Chelmon rostratus TaxID=109905 RepID=UPI001BE5878E|nr:polymeric immunoglobulin receptor-like isoform X2 [Chelmon rostratus]